MTSEADRKSTLLEVAAQRKRESANKHGSPQERAAARALRRRAQGHSWHVQPMPDDSSDSWLITYLDMITLLLVLLLVMLTLSGNGEGGKNENESLAAGNGYLPAQAGLLPLPANSLMPDSAPRQDLTDGLDLDNLGDDIDIILNDKSVSFRINSEILFGSGDAQLSLGGLEVLQRLAHTLKDSPHTVTIEGHTDSVPIRSVRFPSNWELSSARAGSVVRYLEANGIASSRLRAIGYADTRPLAKNTTAAHRAMNRRVELMLEMPAAPREETSNAE